MQPPTNHDLVLGLRVHQQLMTKVNHQSHLTLDRHCQGNSDIEGDQRDTIKWCQKKFVLGIKQDQ